MRGLLEGRIYEQDQIDQVICLLVNVNSFSAKYRNKREIYTFLTVDGEVYLPPFETVTVYYLKDII